ncbi:uncharacterized protein Pyn_27171 [Prunus yedoensis var. nudiflora]|uniref:GAG1At protein n=2 Tax=Prunus TaxID=3754 RepID=A0A314Y688_PRUYE|nr:uncharacterized protein LOC117622195 [Prunus dulcis]KAI5337630.1 hypothetical protein L3X38_016901 [Prunus dulcis]PQQ00369.1 uncharacterized protein Pyn_27171 [Prunus yedoensis var. nudiflora]
MSSEPKTSSATGGGAGGRGFRAKMEHYMYSGEKKHVFAGIVLVSAVFAVPWYLMTRGAKHQSHQDYLEKADKARSQRLSSGASSAK